VSERFSPSVPRSGRRPSRIEAEVEKLRAHYRPSSARGDQARPTLLSRAREILAASVADLLDRADNPARTVRLMIAEMEQVLGEVRASAARTIADRKELQRHHGRLLRLQEDWTGKAQLALSKDREDLARAALIEKRKAGDLASQLEGEIATIDEAVRAYEDDLARLQQRLHEARGRQATIAARLDSAEQRIRLRGLLADERAEEAMTRFEALERRADEAEGRADALGLAEKGRSHGLAADIAALGKDGEFDAELAALRHALGADRPKEG
jgi:phage shock protein A